MPVPWKSKLNPYKNEILRMWKNRNTLPEIQGVLEEKGIKISKQSIWKFIQVRTNKRNPHDIEIPDEKSSEITEEPIPIQNTETSTELNNRINEEDEEQMDILRQRLKRKAHADPMKDIFIRKGDKQ